MLVVKKTCTARFLQQQDGNAWFGKSVQTSACSVQATVHLHSDRRQEIWKWLCMVMTS